MSDIPGHLRYRESHEWLNLEGDVATVGITSFALEQLGDIIDVEVTAESGSEVKQGDPIAEIESVKAASDIYAPVDGKIVDVHADLTEDLDGMAGDPYGKGWIVKILVGDPSQVEGLLVAEAYSEQVTKESG